MPCFSPEILALGFNLLVGRTRVGSVLVSSWETWSPAMERVRPSACLVAMLCSGWHYTKEKKKPPLQYFHQGNWVPLCSPKSISFITSWRKLSENSKLSFSMGTNLERWWEGTVLSCSRQPQISFHQASSAVSPQRCSETTSSRNGGHPRAWSFPVMEKPV